MTIKDIAKLCNVSVSTVSRVLNDRPDVSEDVRRKVLSAIKDSNYIPNNSARDLVRTKSDAIGLVVRGVSNPFYTDIIRAIESTITQAGFTMVMQQIASCDDEIKCGAVMEREKRLRGIIFLGGQFDYTAADLALLNVPFVCCSYSNRYGTLTEGEYSSVSIADEETAREAVRELYRHGHRRIAALISRPDDQSISQLRYEGYVSALEELGLQFPVFGMVKDDRHRTRALVTPQGQEIRIDNNQAIFALIGNIQEETHRFAITYHHESHTRSSVASALDGIPNIGEVRKRKLLARFKSVKAIREAELPTLQSELGRAMGRAVYDHFHPKEETP